MFTNMSMLNKSIFPRMRSEIRPRDTELLCRRALGHTCSGDVGSQCLHGCRADLQVLGLAWCVFESIPHAAISVDGHSFQSPAGPLASGTPRRAISLV